MGRQLDPSQETVETLNQWADRVEQGKENIINKTNSTDSIIQSKSNVLGAHVQAYDNAIQQIRDAVNSSADSVTDVSTSLKSLAKKYEEYLENVPSFGGRGK